MQRPLKSSGWRCSLSSALLVAISLSVTFITCSMFLFDTSGAGQEDADDAAGAGGKNRGVGRFVSGLLGYLGGSEGARDTDRDRSATSSEDWEKLGASHSGSHSSSSSSGGTGLGAGGGGDHVRSAAEVMQCPPADADADYDEAFCHVSPPPRSHFGFPDVQWDPVRWRAAQIAAAAGEQVLLKEVVKHFPHPFDYIDGDRSFRSLQKIVDVFVDSKTQLLPLMANHKEGPWSPIRRLQGEEGTEAGAFSLSKSSSQKQGGAPSRRSLGDELKQSGETTKALHVNGKQLVPSPYNYRLSGRAPIVEMGYTAFDKDLNTYFSGNFAGGNFVKKEWFFKKWDEVQEQLDYPFITMCSLNENWGVLSTNFPNRTAGWGACCNKPSDHTLHKFLAHDKTLMFVINQHSNISHPKLLTLPRGVPTQWEHTERVIWDSQRYVLEKLKKQRLLFAASSSWGKRPQILRCISDKMAVKDFWGHTDASEENKREGAKMKSSRRLYYQKLGTAKIGVAMPGLGYDCFRTWELLTMGSVVVLERGVGLDRTLWRLPALLVEDFDEITPELLRSAYVEAMYRYKEFEFERLTQKFWYAVLYNVSKAQSVAPMLERFPMEAELPNFARPKEPYACSNAGTCGAGTKRTPKNYC